MKIVAEISANHGGNLDEALKLIKIAKTSGADMVKIQTYKPEHLAKKPYKIEGGIWDGRDLKQLYEEAQTPWGWHAELFDYAKEIDIPIFSTPFHPEAVEFLESLNCPIYKISSFDVVNYHLLRAVAETKKPVIMSTGMATCNEIDDAVECLEAEDLTILRCVSAYPSLAKDAHLKTLFDYQYRHHCKVGVSDHTEGIVVAVVAAALGADIIEKHITDNELTVDSAFSLNPREFLDMTEACHEALSSIGKVHYGPMEAERQSLEIRRVRNGK